MNTLKKAIPLLLAAVQLCTAQLTVRNLLVEHQKNPIGLGIRQPCFIWQLASDKRNMMQTAYELRVARDAASLSGTKNLIWDSGKVTSDSSVHVIYKGEPLRSGEKYFWSVKVWDNGRKESRWSEPSTFQMGLLDSSDWKAKWISVGFREDSTRPCPIFRKQFMVRGHVRSAVVYVTAHGLYEAHVNGRRVGDAYFTPGWTSYKTRLQYQTYDVTGLLRDGANAMGVVLGSGWYRGYIGYSGKNDAYGDDASLLLQLDIVYDDGTKESVVTDETWKSSTGSIKGSELYHGETIDARSEKEGWATTQYDDTKWASITTKDFGKSNLVPTLAEPIRKHEQFAPVEILTTPKGEKVIDFGQNLVGWVVVKARGKSGDTISIKHAEVLDKQGNFYTENLRGARAEETYILSGKGTETFEPHFTFHGFRYIKVEGISGELNPGDFTAVAVYSDLPQTGRFVTSHELLNKLQHNIEWSQKGNFVGVPTDCPQRDERLGWTGDAQAFSRTATFNMNANNFFAGWLKDLAADQASNGSVPFVAPNVLGDNANGSSGWADAATIVPWNVYVAYGDKRVLEAQYESMKGWVEYMHSSSKNDLFVPAFQFGDWLFYSPDDDAIGRAAITNKELISQSFYAFSTQILASTARVLGKIYDAEMYDELFRRIKEAYVREFVSKAGRLVSETQTAYALALQFDILPDSLRGQAASRLVKSIREYNNHLTTGFLGAPYVCHVLSRFGYDDVAFKLLLQTTYPSWLYPVTMGATTIWERWDGIKPDGTFETPGMNSFNHYAYGAVGDWMYRVMAGIDTDVEKPGYKKITIQPHIGGGLTKVSADLQTYYGTVSSHWETSTDGTLHVDVEIPVNTSATVSLPAMKPEQVSEGGKKLSALKEIKFSGSRDGRVVLELGSGHYQFVVAK